MRGDEEGFTLVEILITVWIMGAVMVALMGALFTMMRTSDINRKTTEAESESPTWKPQCAPPVQDEGYERPDAPDQRHLHQQLHDQANLRNRECDDGLVVGRIHGSAEGRTEFSSAHLSSSCNSDFGIQVFTLSLTVGPHPP